MATPQKTWVVGAALVVVAALAGCTGDDPDTTQSPSATESTATSPSAPAGSDKSNTVLTASLAPAKGATKGTVSGYAATLNIGEVRVSSTGSVLTYWYTGTTQMLTGQGQVSWENRPTLVDPVGKKVYEPQTFTNFEGQPVCICTDAVYVDGVPQPLTISYPPVPSGVTSVQVRQAGSPPVSVPVTRVP